MSRKLLYSRLDILYSKFSQQTRFMHDCFNCNNVHDDDDDDDDHVENDDDNGNNGNDDGGDN